MLLFKSPSNLRHGPLIDPRQDHHRRAEIEPASDLPFEEVFGDVKHNHGIEHNIEDRAPRAGDISLFGIANPCIIDTLNTFHS